MEFAAALVTHPACALHDPGWGHPEHPGRLRAIADALRREGPILLGRLLQRGADPAGEEPLRLVHTEEHVARVRRAAARAAEEGAPVHLDPDTPVSGASWEAALAAVGCALTAVELVARGEVGAAFAAARPPGHHATADRAMGFCLFNNVAVAARWLQRAHGVGRVLIVDWDVHHGNGTQDIFFEDPTVYYYSLHLADHYPGTGSAAERGAGPGLGTTRNVPLPHGTTAADYRAAFADGLDAALAEFEPEFVLVSAGFDCLRGDPLGGLLLEPADLHWMATTLRERTRATAGGRIAAVLEGGYHLERLGLGVASVLRAFAGLPPAG